jgi:hypothetical protein
VQVVGAAVVIDMAEEPHHDAQTDEPANSADRAERHQNPHATPTSP